MALADSAMVIACSAAWNGYRPMSTIDQTTHFLRPVNFDIVADARVVRIGRNTSFGRVMLLHAADQPPGRHGGERLFDDVNFPFAASAETPLAAFIPPPGTSKLAALGLGAGDLAMRSEAL